MNFQIDERAHIGKVVLKVRDLYSMLVYYQTKLGLDVLESVDNRVTLGVRGDNRELLELVQIDNANPMSQKTGLYHLAFLLPNRSDLGNTLYNLIAVEQLDVEGASDHGYSEALYLSDPEGNGIEITADKPRSEWLVHADGHIEGYTKPLDANTVLDARDREAVAHMPKGTVIGHVHLSVQDLVKSEKFYSDVLGFDLKHRFGPESLFYAAGDYHHHIGLNIWNSKKAENRGEKDLGLDYFTMILPNNQALKELKNHIESSSYKIFDETDDSFFIQDNSKIKIKFIVEKTEENQ